MVRTTCCLQMVIDANLVPSLITALLMGEFKTQKEAAWAVSNFTVGGTPEQVGFNDWLLLYWSDLPPVTGQLPDK